MLQIYKIPKECFLQMKPKGTPFLIATFDGKELELKCLSERGL